MLILKSTVEIEPVITRVEVSFGEVLEFISFQVTMPTPIPVQYEH